MDALTRFALVGAARAPEGHPALDDGELARAVLTRLVDLPVERRVLLAAGARAAAAMAGYRETRSEEAFAMCPPETRRACSPKAARIVGDLLRGHHEELLAEALALLARAGQRIPHALLPDALRVRGADLHEAVRRVVGERGVWLARLNEAWEWAAIAEAPASLEDLERAWLDGSAEARRIILARARRADADRARGWLEATWATEKADERAALLAVLREGIGSGDEAFLEAQLRDRAAGVREAAQALLPCLTGSAFVRRMTERADRMLELKRSALGFVGKRGTLHVHPPESVDDESDRDGLVAKPPQGVGARAFWLTRAVAAVPPEHWTARFGVSPEHLVAAAEATDWAGAACEGWTRAALVRGEIAWLAALWDFWQLSDEKVAPPRAAMAMLAQILRGLPPEEAAARVEPLLSDARTRIDLRTALSALQTPWPARLGARWLDALRRDLGSTSPLANAFASSLPMAALALPSECFAGALKLADASPAEGPLSRALADFAEIVRLRFDLVQEIVP